jgi:hypothetical protein
MKHFSERSIDIAQKKNPAQPAKLDAIVQHEIRVNDIGKGKKNSIKLMFSFGIKAIQT